MEALFKVKVFSLSKGMEIIDNVRLIRIKSSDYNLLLMPGYMSILGEIDGSIDLELDNNTINYDNVVAYYVHSNNEFLLLLKEI